MVNTTEGLNNATITQETDNCTLHYFHVWPSTCSESMISHYKWISLVLGLAFFTALALHFNNMAVRLVQSKFKINIKDSTVRVNILCIMASICGVLEMSNYYGYHHNDYCISSVAGTLCTSLLVSIT